MVSRRPMFELEGAELIKVFITADRSQWVVYPKRGWTIDDKFRFLNTNDLGAFRMVVEKATQWNLQDAEGRDIPLDKSALLRHIELVSAGIWTEPVTAQDSNGATTTMEQSFSLPAIPEENESALYATLRILFQAINALPFVSRSLPGSLAAARN